MQHFEVNLIRSPSLPLNRRAMLERLAALEEQQALARAGGGTTYTDRHRDRGRLLAHQRIELLLDEDAAFLELSTVAAWGTDYTVGASVVTGIGVVSGHRVHDRRPRSDRTGRGVKPVHLEEGAAGDDHRPGEPPSDDQPG